MADMMVQSNRIIATSKSKIDIKIDSELRISNTSKAVEKNTPTTVNENAVINEFTADSLRAFSIPILRLLAILVLCPVII
jgi:hypothetical protein